MKVFFFSGKQKYNFGYEMDSKGYFVQEDKEEIKGYIEEKRMNKITVNAIKGIYNKDTSQMIFIKTSAPGGYKPEIYIFGDPFTEAWVSAYSDVFETFTVYGGVKNASFKLDSFECILKINNENENIFSHSIIDKYNQYYNHSSQLSKSLIENVTKYKWLFDFIKHLKRSAK